MAHEENFFEKARRVLLRAVGVAPGKGGAGGDSTADGGHLVASSAAEIEAKHKIKASVIFFCRVVFNNLFCGQFYLSMTVFLPLCVR